MNWVGTIFMGIGAVLIYGTNRLNSDKAKASYFFYIYGIICWAVYVLQGGAVR